MGKLKTNKGVQKRIRVTKSGKFVRWKAGRRHLLQTKASKRKMHMRKRQLVSNTMKSSVRRLLPYA